MHNTHYSTTCYQPKGTETHSNMTHMCHVLVSTKIPQNLPHVVHIYWHRKSHFISINSSMCTQCSIQCSTHTHTHGQAGYLMWLVIWASTMSFTFTVQNTLLTSREHRGILITGDILTTIIIITEFSTHTHMHRWLVTGVMQCPISVSTNNQFDCNFYQIYWAVMHYHSTL